MGLRRETRSQTSKDPGPHQLPRSPLTRPLVPPAAAGPPASAEPPRVRFHQPRPPVPPATCQRDTQQRPPVVTNQSNLPVRENCFLFNAPDGGDVSIDDLLDAVVETTGDDSVLVLQHMGGSKFLVCTRNANQATRLMVAEGFKVHREHVAVEAVGPAVPFVNVYRFPAYLPDDVLVNALGQYGKVKSASVSCASIAGCAAYALGAANRGTWPRPAGRLIASDAGVFGHDTEGCTEECKRCGGRHGMRECFRKRSYVAAERGFPLDVGAPSVDAKVTPPPTPTNVPDHWEHEELREREHARGASTSPAPMAVPPEVVDEMSNTSSEGDQGESSGLESGSPESSSDSWDPSQTESAEQEVPGTLQSPVTDEPAFPGLDAENFPPLLSEPTSPLTRRSCPSSSAEKQPPGSTLSAPTPANAPAAQPGPVRRDRSRSMSPLRGGNEPAGAEPSHPSSRDNKHRRPKMHVSSSDSDAPPTAKSQKLDTPPSGKGHTPPSAGGELVSTCFPCCLSPRLRLNPWHQAMSFLKFATWNVRGFRDRAKQRDVLVFAQAQGIDVLFIQETNFRTPLDVSRFRGEFQVDAFFSLTTARACGVGVFFVTGRFRQKAFCTFDANGRMLMLDMYVNGKRFRFVNVYAPVTRTNTNNFFQDLHQSLSEPLPHVLLGDFNCVIDSQRDVRGPGRGSTTYQAKELVKVLRHLCLSDVWLQVHGDLFVPTRSSQISSSRIDRTYLPDFLLPSVVACEVLSPSADLAGRSDHLPLATTLSGFPGPCSDGQGWRLDSALLQDDDSIKHIRERLQESVTNAQDMTPLSCEALKEEWRRILQEEGRARKHRITTKMNEILRRIRIVKGAESLTACTRSYLNSLEVEYARLLQRRALRPPKERDKPAIPIAADPNEANWNGSPLLANIERNESSRGFPLTGEAVVKVLAYAGDVSLFVRDPASLQAFWTTFASYAEALGAELNMRKSKALPFGAFARGALGNLEVVDAVKVLGIYFCCGGVAETTWQRALERAQAAITRLSLEDLTLREKALAVKTTICAFAYYASRIAVMPTKMATQLSKMIRSFLWEGKPAPRAREAFGLSHVLTTSKVFALKTTRALYHASDYVGRGLMRYWCSTNAAFLNADRPLAPLAESPSSFYKSAANTMRMLEKEAPDCDVDEVPPARIAEEIARHQITPDECRMTVEEFPDPRTTSCGGINWDVLPTRQRLHKFGIVPSPRCSNCRGNETLTHALFDCPAAKPVWRLVARDFKIRSLPELKRNRGAFAKLVVACTIFTIWKRRCLAEARRKPVRAAFPAVSRVRGMRWQHLSEQLESSGEEKFLRRWHTRFFLLQEGKLRLPITPF
ncbi:hypothetical protein HPB52_006656 [Rhipicephalus sanguineus]|uniref:exodeoxyribonuclease III n=1 Tax=Rhipicephalus sanguineus TaxID=34632 RepID=A0A9D4PUW3_RHISA|nr:hypothetical protein HPB52_006656 [Rhipicephalus sanguineus]